MDPVFLGRSPTIPPRESGSSDSVGDLGGLNLAPINVPGSAPEIGTGDVNRNLANILGEGKKASHLHAVLESAGLGGAFDSRCQKQPGDLKKLSGMLHFDKRKTLGASQAGRLALRSALTLAFARGADISRLEDLRIYCKDNLLSDRGNVVARLATETGDVNAFVDQLFDNPDYEVAFLKASGMY
jgi:hypothetical protein